MDRDQFQQWLTERSDALGGDLDTLDEAQLTDISDGLSSRFEALREKRQGDGLDDDEMAEFREQVWPNLQAVRGQQQNRQARRDEANSEIDAAFNEYDASAAEPEQENGEGEEQETEGDDESTEETPEQVEQAAMAAAASAKKGGKAKTTAKPRVPEIGTTGGNGGGGPKGHQPSVAIVAAGGHASRSTGTAMRFDEIGEAMSDRLRALRSTGGRGEQSPVVTLRASGVPESRTLHRGDIGGNTNKLDAVTSRTSLVAAGGLCAPLAIDYSYQTIGVQGRPVRDSLPGFQADRGGILYRPDVSPVTNVDANGPRKATGIWTNDNDENAYASSNPPRKAVWIVDCPNTETAEVEAITLQTEWSNVTSRFDPETVQANQAAALIWHDRFAENHLLDQLKAMSKVATSAQVLGAVCDVLVTLDRAQAYFRSAHRLGANVALRAIMPFWVKHLLRADMARRMALDPMAALNVSDAQIDSMLQTRGLTPVWHLDGNPATDTMGTSGSTTDDVDAQQYTLATAGQPVKPFPKQIDMLMHAEGCFTHLDGGTLDLGIVRDSDLIDRNRYRQFSETWEGVAKRGVEALRLIATVAPTGETAGAVDVPATA